MAPSGGFTHRGRERRISMAPCGGLTLPCLTICSGFGSLHLQRVHQARPTFSPPPDAADADAMTLGSAKASGGAPQPAIALQPLHALNKSSGRVATFAVRFSGCRLVHYSYRKRQDNQLLTGHKFEAWLVGTNAQEYCIGYVKGTEAECTKAMATYTEACVCALSKVSFDNWTQAAYISTPVNFRVDLAKSKITILDHAR